MSESLVTSFPKQFGVTKFRVKNRSVLAVPLYKSSNIEAQKHSCIRCRKLKKKCSKEVPECAACTMSGDYCKYSESKRPRTQSLCSSSFEKSPTSGIASTENLNYVLGSPNTTLNEANTLEQKAVSPCPGPVYLPPIDTFKSSNSLDVLQCKLLSNSFNISPKGSTCPPIPVHLTTRYFEAFQTLQEQAGTFITLDDIKSREVHSSYALANNKTLACKFNLVVAIGAAFLFQTQNNMLTLEVHKLGASARENALELISNENLISNSTLPITEILILITLYSCLDREPSLSWNMIGMTTRNILLMHLNRKSDHSEYRQRLFWSCYNLDRLISFSLIRPVALEDDYIDIPMMDGHQFIAVTSLRVLEGKLLRNAVCVSSCGSSESVKKLRGLIDRWYNQLICEHSKEQSALNSTQSWYLAEYYNLLLLLYYPSNLESTPSKSHLKSLEFVCSKYLPCIYYLKVTKVLVYNWISFHRVLFLLSAYLYCLNHGAYRLCDSSISQYLSVLQGYVKTWPFTVDFIQILESLPKMLPNEALASYEKLLRQHSIRIN